MAGRERRTRGTPGGSGSADSGTPGRDGADFGTLELMSAHYEGCRAEIISLMQANERLLNLSILVLGGVYGYGIAQNITQLVALAPVAIAIVMLQGLQRYQLVHHLGGYKKYLEEMMNQECGRKVVFWEELCCTLYHRNWYNYCLRLLYLLVAVLCVVEGTKAFEAMIRTAATPRPGLWVAIYLLAVAVVAFSILINFLRFKRSFDLGYSEARRLAAPAPPALP